MPQSNNLALVWCIYGTANVIVSLYEKPSSFSEWENVIMAQMSLRRVWNHVWKASFVQLEFFVLNVKQFSLHSLKGVAEILNLQPLGYIATFRRRPYCPIWSRHLNNKAIQRATTDHRHTNQSVLQLKAEKKIFWWVQKILFYLPFIERHSGNLESLKIGTSQSSVYRVVGKIKQLRNSTYVACKILKLQTR